MVTLGSRLFTCLSYQLSDMSLFDQGKVKWVIKIMCTSYLSICAVGLCNQG